MKTVKKANLPENSVAVCAVSAKAAGEIAALQRLGIEAVAVEPSPLLAVPVSSHADMLLHHVGGEKLFAAQPNSSHCRRLEQLGFNILDAGVQPHGNYPNDITLNIASIGDFAVMGKKCPESELKRLCRQTKSCIEVGQGYAKCSICIIAEDAVVTADDGIAEALLKAGLDVLKISPGGIAIEGYDTGFIGGCCGLIARDVLAFCGDVTLHKDGGRIVSFARERGVYIERLTDGIPKDVGGILPLAEK